MAENNINKNKKHSKNEFIFIVGLLFVSFFCLFFLKRLHRENADYAQIMVDGKIIGNYSLAEEKTFLIETESGHYNKVIINQGEIYVSEADCPDLNCVKQGAINKNAQTVICLPHKLVITVFANDVNEIDAMTN